MATHSLRPAALAGRFYPSDPVELAHMIDEYLGDGATPSTVLAAIAPHAGLVYSGPVAGRVLSRVAITETVVILCPKHTRMGAHTSLLTSGEWALPGGSLAIDEALAQHLFAHLPDVVDDPLAHAQEHAIEVLLPFLQRLRPGVRFVPIAMGFRDHASCQRFGEALGKAIEAWDERILLIASSDMNHFEDLPTTIRKDRMAIERIEALDPAGLFATCQRHGISMCGVVPTTVVMYALATRLQRAELVCHTTSAAVSGDESRVVGYAGMTFS